MSDVLQSFHFLRPAWLLLLLLLPLLPWLWRLQQRRANAWRAAVDPHLLPALLDGDPAPRQRRSALALAMAALLLATLALAGPAWRLQPQPLLRSDAGLIIALDLSPRMRAADLLPDRATRARFEIADVLRRRGEGQVALIAYAGDAFTVSPLTSDLGTLEGLLSALEPDVMPLTGQRADRAIERAMQLARDAGLASTEVLLLTDRADADAVRTAARARDAGLRVSVLGVGTPQGAPIPLPDGGFVTDEDGRPQLAALQADTLEALAAAGGGRFALITADDTDLRRLGVLEPSAAAWQEDAAAETARYRDEGPWLLLLLLPLAALGFRRGWLGCVPIAATLALAAPPAQALDWSALWLRQEQRAQRALEAGDYERARELARDPLRRGTAAYRAGDYPAAAAAFADGDSADAHYNRGNALARAGQLQDALAAYDAALERAPGMQDALANRAAVERLLQHQQQQQPQQEQRQQPGQPSQGQPSRPQSGGEPSPDRSGEPPSEPGESEPASDQDRSAREPTEREPSERDAAQGSSGDHGEPAEPPPPPAVEQQQALSREIEQALEAQQTPPPAAPIAAEREQSETEQATEQMLRRVPDDPGGLLRRKFTLEHRRRQLEQRGDD